MALTSEVPPRPQPTKTFMSSLTWKSNSPVSGPTCASRVVDLELAQRLGCVSGYSPGWSSRPRSSRHTDRPARASREAAIAPP